MPASQLKASNGVPEDEEPDDFWSDLANLPALDELCRQLEAEGTETKDPLAQSSLPEEEEDFFRSVLNVAPFQPSNQYTGTGPEWSADCWDPSKEDIWWNGAENQDSFQFLQGAEAGAGTCYSEEYGFDNAASENSWHDYYIRWNNADPDLWSADLEGWNGNLLQTMESGKTGLQRGARPVRPPGPAPVHSGIVQSATEFDKGTLFPHKSVPKRKVIKGSFDEKTGPITTAMIRNVPNKCTRKQLLDELDRAGLHASYDFVYMPMDQSTGCNVGYAFVNFVNPEAFDQCVASLSGRRMFQLPSGKKTHKNIIVSPAHLQGLESNLKHYRDCAVAHTPNRPLRMGSLRAAEARDCDDSS